MGRIRRWLRKRSPEGLILLYHRVATLESDPQLLSVTPRHFADHLEVLCRYYRRATLADIASDGGFRETAVMITFDDGYADNLYEALPILSASEWPATVFITTGQIGQNCEFWWDELERIFLRTARVPATLRLTIAGRELVWHISDCEQSPDPTWNVLRNKTRTGRQCAYIDLGPLTFVALGELSIAGQDPDIVHAHNLHGGLWMSLTHQGGGNGASTCYWPICHGLNWS